MYIYASNQKEEEEKERPEIAHVLCSIMDWYLCGQPMFKASQRVWTHLVTYSHGTQHYAIYAWL
ncbi:hypothetical protein RchiOBHm_Chr2g0128011 [Rosa chinensis]|uniref:Uncharacterized protein n=1 Tax=Rosa chinensis TaxID=74649 RepID=A0A2P6RU81_ROSCH|nr:hypothetical protein RchiOBHm_Chr2g0128011 [Rosa chinensis]